jgi:hypothetical protein
MAVITSDLVDICEVKVLHVSLLPGKQRQPVVHSSTNYLVVYRAHRDRAHTDLTVQVVKKLRRKRWQSPHASRGTLMHAGPPTDCPASRLRQNCDGNQYAEPSHV